MKDKNYTPVLLFLRLLRYKYLFHRPILAPVPIYLHKLYLKQEHKVKYTTAKLISNNLRKPF